MGKKPSGIVLCALALTLFARVGPGKELAAEPPQPGSGQPRYEEPKYLTGAIYAPGSKQLLFKFKRVADRSGSTLNVQRDFTYPDGTLAARERVLYEGNELVRYELEEKQIGAGGSARIRRDRNNSAKGSIDFEYTKKSGERPKRRSEPLRDHTLIADMVGPFLVSHWDTLRRGEKLKCRYIVVPRTETVGFTFAKDSESTQQGQQVLVVRMEASSFFISKLVSPLFFTIEVAPPHRVLQYTGRTTPKTQAGGHWEDLDAVTVFDWASAR